MSRLENVLLVADGDRLLSSRCFWRHQPGILYPYEVIVKGKNETSFVDEDLVDPFAEGTTARCTSGREKLKTERRSEIQIVKYCQRVQNLQISLNRILVGL